jgi:hypothetical protein
MSDGSSHHRRLPMRPSLAGGALKSFFLIDVHFNLHGLSGGSRGIPKSADSKSSCRRYSLHFLVKEQRSTGGASALSKVSFVI